jgi:serine/threonine-protein kinase
MAPERFSNAEVTYRADIYALACVLHECLTGSPPYKADSAGTLVTAHLMDPIPQASAVRSGIPKAFDEVIARGMAKKPEDRYASAGDLALAAHEALSDPDQDHAEDILRHSREVTLPGTSQITPSSSLPPTMAASPTPVNTPQPVPVQGSPSPYPASGPTSDPVPSQSGQPWAPDSGPMRAAGQPAPNAPYYQGSSGNWGGPPSGGPQQFSGATPWSQPAPKPKRNPWPIIAAVAVVIVVVVCGVSIAVVMGGDDNNRNASSTTTTTTTTRSTTTTTTPTSSTTAMQNKLLGMLPSGYPYGACTPTTPQPDSIWNTSVAMVSCKQNTKQGGPSHAIYGLFPNLAVLKKAFDDDIAAGQLMDCPGGGPSPDSWHYNQSPTVTAGMVACATYKNQPNVVWTNEANLMLSDAFGDPPILDDLHAWWLQYG